MLIFAAYLHSSCFVFCNKNFTFRRILTIVFPADNFGGFLDLNYLVKQGLFPLSSLNGD